MSIKAYGNVTVVNVNDGAKGDTGVGVASVTPMYYLSTSYETAQGGQWSTTKPEITPGTYLFTKQVATLSNGDTVSSDAVCDYTITGIDQRVSQAENSIRTKVWEEDILSRIYEAEDLPSGYVVAENSIRDKISTTEQTVDNITSTVGVWTTALSQNGTKTIADKISSIIQDADGFHTTVSNTYATKTENTATLNSAKTYAEQLSDRFYLYVEGTGGQSSSITLTNTALQAITNQFIIKDTTGSATIISGGRIHANAITTAMLATDAIKSTNYRASSIASSPYSGEGSFFNLSTGSIETPNFAIYNATTQGGQNAAYINGEIIATSGRIGGYGEETDGYWEIGNKVDASMTQRAAIISHGNTYIQSGMFMLHDRKVNTQSFMTTGTRNGQITFPTYSYYYNYSDPTESTNTNTYYDYGIQAPQVNSTGNNNLFLYGRRIKASDFIVDSNTQLTESQWETYSWDYFFKIDRHGNIYTNGTIYEKGQALSSRYASISGTESAYLPRTGGTISGNLTVQGTITGTASKAIGDKNGYDITTTYLKLSGGTLSGPLTVNDEIQAVSITAGNLQGDLTGNATSATSATKDSGGNTITTTYIKALSVNGTTITATRGDDTTFTITTQDTNTDTLVTQAYSTSGSNYPILMSATAGITSTSSRGAKTTIVNNGLYAIPSTGKIRATGGFIGDLEGNADTATLATTADAWTNSITITIGSTGKSVNGSGNVTWSKADVSGNASTSDSGWMSSDDKAKLDAIKISDIDDVISADSIIGTSGINVSIVSGVATISGLFKVPTASGNSGQTIISNGTTGVWTDFSASLITSGTLPVARGGTGQTSAVNAANAFINALSTGTSTPQDDDYYIAQYAGGGTTTTTYHRRKVSALWTYIKGKITADTNLNVTSATKATQDGDGNAINSTYLKLSGGTVTGTLVLSKTTDLSGTANNSPALIVGGTTTTQHMEIDNNEIQAKTNGTSVATLNLNLDGGIIYTGTGGINTKGTVTVGSHSVLTYNSAYNCLEFSFV